MALSKKNGSIAHTRCLRVRVPLRCVWVRINIFRLRTRNPYAFPVHDMFFMQL